MVNNCAVLPGSLASRRTVPPADFGHGRAGNQTIVEMQPKAFPSGRAGARLDAEVAGFGQLTGVGPTGAGWRRCLGLCRMRWQGRARRMRPTRPSRRPLAGAREGKAQVTMMQLPGLVVAVQGPRRTHRNRLLPTWRHFWGEVGQARVLARVAGSPLKQPLRPRAACSQSMRARIISEKGAPKAKTF
jgi:hypothetical protein